LITIINTFNEQLL